MFVCLSTAWNLSWTSLLVLLNLSRLFHCSVINVLCFVAVSFKRQLIYYITFKLICQQLFSFSKEVFQKFFFHLVISQTRQLWYLIISNLVCQQLFKKYLLFPYLFLSHHINSFLRWTFILPSLFSDVNTHFVRFFYCYFVYLFCYFLP